MSQLRDKMLLAATMIIYITAGAGAGPTYQLSGFTNHNPVHAQIGERQIFVAVQNAEAGKVLFVFRNQGLYSSSVTALFFDNGSFIKSRLTPVTALDNSDTQVGYKTPGGALSLPDSESLDDIVNELDGGNRRIGFLVESFGSRTSGESFTGVPMVAEPSAVLLSSVGLVLIRLLRSRQVIE